MDRCCNNTPKGLHQGNRLRPTGCRKGGLQEMDGLFQGDEGEIALHHGKSPCCTESGGPGSGLSPGTDSGKEIMDKRLFLDCFKVFLFNLK